MNPFRKKPMPEHDPADRPDTEEQPDEVQPEGVPDGQPDDVEAAQDDGSGADPAAELENLRAEKAALYEKLAKAQADFQNATRRMEKDGQARLGVAVAGFVRELLPVLDNLERAQQVDPESPASAVLDGIKGTHAEFLKVLASRGVERVAPEPGDEFDPNDHEALMRQPHDEHPANTVVQTYQPGYRLDGKTVRPAQVVVSQGDA